jgi:hypothetical protein
MRIGTSNFVNLTKACDYYRTQDAGSFTPAGLESYVKHLVERGDIHLGKPDVPVGGKLLLIDNNCRYAIEE